MDPDDQNNLMLYLMLIVCSSLITMNTFEIYRLTIQWKNFTNTNSDYFSDCIKPQFFVKSFFSIYSFLATFSALLLTLCLLINFALFCRKFMASYLKFVYFTFGPCMLICSILGLINWNQTFYICRQNQSIERTLSFSSSASIIICFIFALCITFTIEFYNVMGLYTNTIANNPEGNKILKSIFWSVCMKLNRRQRSSLPHNNNNNMRERVGDRVRENIILNSNNNQINQNMQNNHILLNGNIPNDIENDNHNNNLENCNDNNNTNNNIENHEILIGVDLIKNQTNTKKI